MCAVAHSLDSVNICRIWPFLRLVFPGTTFARIALGGYGMNVLSRINVGPREHEHEYEQQKSEQLESTFAREETGRKAALTAMTSLVDPPIEEDEPSEEEKPHLEDTDADLSIAALCAAYLAEDD